LRDFQGPVFGSRAQYLGKYGGNTSASTPPSKNQKYNGMHAGHSTARQ
jgi:hypothetical protein